MNTRTQLTILSPVAKYRHPKNHKTIETIGTSGHFDVALVEAFGFSEVARARNIVASKAEEHVRNVGGLVFWLDADMVLPNIEVFLLHVACVRASDRAISGRYVVRQDESRIAASRHEFRQRPHEEYDIGSNMKLTLEHALCGMGCLLMTASMFLDQLEAVPTCFRKENGEEFRERLVCCPRIEEHPTSGHVMISEDYDYCRSIENGTWLAHISNGESLNSWLDYGHVAEKTLMHSPKPHTFRDDR